MNLQHFQRFQSIYASVLLCAYVLINNTVNATTQIMEAQREGALTFLMWEPFVWEYSSALSTLLIFPILIWLLLGYFHGEQHQNLLLLHLIEKLEV